MLLVLLLCHRLLLFACLPVMLACLVRVFLINRHKLPSDVYDTVFFNQVPHGYLVLPWLALLDHITWLFVKANSAKIGKLARNYIYCANCVERRRQCSCCMVLLRPMIRSSGAASCFPNAFVAWSSLILMVLFSWPWVYFVFVGYRCVAQVHHAHTRGGPAERFSVVRV